MDKKELRKTLRARAAALPEQERRAASRAIARSVIASDAFRRAETVFAYVSTALEPDTAPILEAAWAAGKRVAVPKCGENGAMRALLLTDPDALRPGTYGLPEPPEDAPEVEPDLILVPCLAASKGGARLGHGGGYYDRYLRWRRAATLCLCFEALLSEDIPMTELDIPMDCVVTERGCHFKEGTR